ncbi:helix-turn-helix domain-containing protein [Gammaproteobacteria bacterium]|nr:helix-turn-helix domain-containing protein [Gammaproteobacteria bacterium]
MSNTIIRAARRHRFVIIDQRAIEDARLSWAARGLLGYLLSRPDDWKVLVNDLRKRGDLGRDGIYRLLRELRDAGYMRFVNARDKHGRIRGGAYIVQEIATAPHPDLPDTVEPDTAVPDPVNPEALPTTEVNLIKTTTTIPTDTKGCCSSGENENGIPEYATWVPDELRAAATEKVAGLDAAAAQLVIDEWAGIMATGRIERSPLGYLHALVNRFESGEFRLKYAAEVAQIRSSTATPPGHSPISMNNLR